MQIPGYRGSQIRSLVFKPGTLYTDWLSKDLGSYDRIPILDYRTYLELILVLLFPVFVYPESLVVLPGKTDLSSFPQLTWTSV